MGGGPEKGELKHLASAASGCRVVNEPIYLADYFQKQNRLQVVFGGCFAIN